jgi:hypothetical protein
VHLDRAGRDRVERRAVRRDDAAVGDDVAHQRAALDPRDPDPVAADRLVPDQPAARDEDDPGEDRERDDPDDRPPGDLSADGGLREGSVLGGGFADH